MITDANLLTQLQPGDNLLYRAKGVFGWVISIKTWSPIAHCECYIGQGRSVASRDGVGVGQYPLRTQDLAFILRPKLPIDLEAGLAWFKTVEGQKYDWFGLLRFAWRSRFLPGDPNNKQFCSEFLTRFDRAMGIDPFNHADADARPPAEFLISNVFDVRPV